jgi:uncharacterized membrane protein YeaQ/YmgE (transglycosylase-associated protein family)
MPYESNKKIIARAAFNSVIGGSTAFAVVSFLKEAGVKLDDEWVSAIAASLAQLNTKAIVRAYQYFYDDWKKSAAEIARSPNLDLELYKVKAIEDGHEKLTEHVQLLPEDFPMLLNSKKVSSHKVASHFNLSREFTSLVIQSQNRVGKAVNLFFIYIFCAVLAGAIGYFSEGEQWVDKPMFGVLLNMIIGLVGARLVEGAVSLMSDVGIFTYCSSACQGEDLERQALLKDTNSFGRPISEFTTTQLPPAQIRRPMFATSHSLSASSCQVDRDGYSVPRTEDSETYATINGAKMSKSRGTFITAKQYAQHLNPECLRYYFAAKLSNGVDDIDLNLQDFMQRVNSDLVGKYINLASRTAGFITKKFAGQLAAELPDTDLYSEFVQAGEQIAEYYESLQYGHAVRAIMALADKANQYIDHHQPWAMAKVEAQLPEVQPVCTQGLNLFRVLTTYLKPILPELASKVESFLNIEPLAWQDNKQPLLDHNINKFKPLLQRITDEQLEALNA